MAIFQAKAAPSEEKLRGGYYTPTEVADFIARWAIAEQVTTGRKLQVLEPSCGDGSILKSIPPSLAEVTAVELDPVEAEKAKSLGNTDVFNADFFEWLGERGKQEFDAVVGNPPYIRFGNWREQERTRALEYIATAGLRPSKLINAWLPFVIASINSTKPGGRVALVLPAELLQVSYAAQTRQYLVENCKTISLVSFKTLLFEGVLQEVVLLLAEVGDGPAVFSSAEVPDASALNSFEVPPASIPAPENHAEKWTTFYLGSSNVELIRKIRTDHRLARMRDFAKVNVGVVTGRNSFFCLTEDQAENEGLLPWTVPLVARSAHLSGLKFTNAKYAINSEKGLVSHLLSLPEDTDISKDENLKAYILKGESDGVHTGYKTRIRKKWWSVPSVMVPDGFMLRQISTRSRIFANHTAATSTDTVHRVFLTTENITIDQLSVAALNSITACFGEVLGRSYGGGILELEPSEASSLPIPDPSLVSNKLLNEVEKALESGDIEGAITLVDSEILVNQLNFTEAEIAGFHEIHNLLSARRKGRGATKPKR